VLNSRKISLGNGILKNGNVGEIGVGLVHWFRRPVETSSTRSRSLR
jgi:hypothetical protein